MNSSPTTPTASDQPAQKASTGAAVSFQQKSNLVTLVVVATIALAFFARVRGMAQAGATEAGAALPAGYGGLVLTTVILIAIVEAVLQAVLALGAGAVPAETARDREASRRAQRNGYGVLVAGVFLTFSSLFWNPSLFVMGNLLLLSFVLAELTRLASQIFFYQRN